MFKTIMNSVMAVSLAAGMAMSTAAPAEADRYSRGVGIGIAGSIIGLGLLGAATAHAHPRYYSSYNDDACYYGPRECHWSGRRCFENSYGDTVCRGGRYLCERPLICE